MSKSLIFLSVGFFDYLKKEVGNGIITILVLAEFYLIQRENDRETTNAKKNIKHQ